MTSDQMQKFVQSRINPTLQQPYFASIINQDNDSLKYKQIRNSSMFFRTSSTPKALEGVDIDYLSLMSGALYSNVYRTTLLKLETLNR